MAASYRFFPWVRRGLAAALAPAAALPARALARIKVIVTPELVEQREFLLLGPGDIVGIDHRLVVRTDPRANAPDFEPNYMASIDFDAPDLPWLFTPAGAGPDGRVPPWLVLVVVDRERVALPRVMRGRPLPFIEVRGNLAASELPNLADAWAWAHAQRVVADGDSNDDARELTESPDLNVSRLVAPRRLAPNRRWLACVVPAFDAGVSAGLGVPRANPNAPLAPAWQAGSQDVVLPVYYHWEFDTGEAGDFEYLARRLRPVRASAQTNAPAAQQRARVFLGTVDGRADTFAALPPTAAASSMRLDAPLEMLDQTAPAIGDVPVAFSEAIVRATAPATGASEDLLPPVYGERFPNRSTVTTAERASQWLDELNLDPRTRVAARSGGDTVRHFQEDLMEAAWAQIGDVLAANAQVARSRFMAMVAERAIERHVAVLPPARVLALAAPLIARLRDGSTTVAARIRRTSLPDAAFDPALRRLSSPAARLSRMVARRAALAQRSNVRHALARGIAAALQRDEAIVDPSIVPRDGVLGLGIGIAAAAGQPIAPGTLWTSALDPNVTVDASLLATRPPDTPLSTQPREDIERTGIITEQRYRSYARAAAELGLPVSTLARHVRAAAEAAPEALRIAALNPSDASSPPRWVAVARDPEGRLVMVDAATRSRLPLFELEGVEDDDVVDAALAGAPAAVLHAGSHRATLVRRGDRRPGLAFELRASAEVVEVPVRFRALARGVERPPSDRVLRIEADAAVPPEQRLFHIVLPAPLRDEAAVRAVRRAFSVVAPPVPAGEVTPTFVPAAIGAGAVEMPAAVRTAIAPSDSFRKRVRSIVSVPAWARAPASDVFDPIMTAPVLKAAFAELYARVAPERFLPLDLELPDESITVLQTNPRFVAAFMVGANHEMNRELLWRTYPTDGRGTPAKRFWNWFDGRVDVDAIHAWPAPAPLAARLTTNVAQIVLVLRGRLLRRYPNTLVLAWRAQARGKLADVPAGGPAARRPVLREPVFRMFLEPDIALVGFDLSVSEFSQPAEPGWYIVLQEPITEPRFGLDEPGTPSGRGHSRSNDLNWSGTAVAAGGHLAASNALLVNPATSATIAEKLLQRPVRVALHSTQIVPIL
jgi:hypothetical protein